MICRLDKNKKIKFTPGDYSYQWDSETDSPFQKRSMAVFPLEGKLKANMLAVRQRIYDLYFSNEKESYLSRNLTSQQIKKRADQSQFYKESDLIGNPRQIESALGALLTVIITRLESDPQRLFKEADKIQAICVEENYNIPEIEAFHAIQNFEEFMRLLKSIQQNNSPFKFELSVSAIVQYAQKCRWQMFVIGKCHLSDWRTQIDRQSFGRMSVEQTAKPFNLILLVFGVRIFWGFRF